MQFYCPYGWELTKKTGDPADDAKIVNICDGVCDSTHGCEHNECPFYDVSESASRRFLKAYAWEQQALEKKTSPEEADLTTTVKNFDEQLDLVNLNRIWNISQEDHRKK